MSTRRHNSLLSLTNAFVITLGEAPVAGLPVLHYNLNGPGKVLKDNDGKVSEVQRLVGENLFSETVISEALGFELRKLPHLHL